MSANWDDMAVVGRVARPHGIRGQVIINPETDFPEERFRADAELFIRRGERIEAVTITTARLQNGRPVVGLRGVDDVDAASAYAGAELRVPVEWLAPLPEGVFYRHDLVGCRVVLRDGLEVGTVREVEGTMGLSRLVLETPNGEVLVPLVVDICVSIEPVARRMVIDPPAGLLEVNAPGQRRERRSASGP